MLLISTVWNQQHTKFIKYLSIFKKSLYYGNFGGMGTLTNLNWLMVYIFKNFNNRWKILSQLWENSCWLLLLFKVEGWHLLKRDLFSYQFNLCLLGKKKSHFFYKEKSTMCQSYYKQGNTVFTVIMYIFITF